MTSTKRMLQKLVIGGAFLFALSAPTAHAQTPSGSIILETAGGSGLETQWTGCRILFKGKVHECVLSGLQVPITGRAQVAGTVFDMKDIGSLAGTYKAVGNTMELGAGHVTMQNDKKVRMVLGAFSENTALVVPDGGVVVQLK